MEGSSMNLKTKILIGILVIGIVLIGGWRVSGARGVTITTDKTEYKQGESVKITLKNDLKKSIFSHIGSGTPVFCIEYVERKTPAGNWEELFAQCQYPHCIYDIDAPGEIKPGQSKTLEWKPLIYIDGTLKRIQAGSGIYRLISLYQIRGGPSSENWEWKTTKSNEFTIK